MTQDTRNLTSHEMSMFLYRKPRIFIFLIRIYVFFFEKGGFFLYQHIGIYLYVYMLEEHLWGFLASRHCEERSNQEAIARIATRNLSRKMRGSQ